MTTALRVVAAGPFVSFQDAGRPGNMRFGVPASGPIDRRAHAIANLAVGARAEATAIEVSTAGLTLECEAGSATLAVAGGAFTVTKNDIAQAPWSVITLRPGDRIAIAPGVRGRWAYVAVAGEFDVPRWLGRTATHSMSGFGGGALRVGDTVTVVDARDAVDRDGPIPLTPEPAIERVRVVMGPQDQHFTAHAIARFARESFSVTAAADRMGVRLDGPQLDLAASLSIPSEPVMRGSVQVAGDGTATVLFADHQTTGGYPKIATVVSADLDRVAQLRPTDTITFEAIDPAAAVAAAREQAARRADDATTLSRPSLAQRLATENLIGEAGDGDH